MFCCCSLIHEHPRCTTIQECFYYNTLMSVYLFYPNIQPHFSQHFEGLFDLPLPTLLFCCAFRGSCLCTALLHLSFFGARCLCLLPFLTSIPLLSV